MIVLDSLTKYFGGRIAVDKLSLHINEGEIFGLVGPDGAGKTTTIRVLTGIMSSSGGKALLMGTDDIESVKCHIGYVPQRFSLYKDLTVIENIRLMGSLYGADEKQITKMADDILGFTKLLPFKDRLADNLSGGMKQKLALAAGLMHRPKILFLDEPTTGVDPVSRREFWQMLYRLNKEGMTILVSTPYMDEAELCSRIAFMNNGKIISCASPQELSAAYPHKLLELSVATKQVKKYLTGCDIIDINSFGDTYHLVVADAERTICQVETALNKAGLAITELKEIKATLEDVFVALASEVA